MTPRERACIVVEQFEGKTFSNTDEALEWLRQRIEVAITLEIEELAERYGFLIVPKDIFKS